MKFSVITVLGLITLASVAQATDRQFQTACSNQQGNLQVQIFPLAQNHALVGTTETYVNGYKQHSSEELVISYGSDVDGNFENFTSKDGKTSYIKAYDYKSNEITYFPKGSNKPGQLLTCKVVPGAITNQVVFKKGGECNMVAYEALKVCEQSGKYFALERILSEMRPDGGPSCALELICY